MSERIISKRCSHCKTYKTLSEFNKDRCLKDGYKNQCKECGKKIARKYSSTERAKELARKRKAKYRNTIKGQEYEYHYSRSEQNKLSRKRYARKFPEKHRARNAVNCAVRKGRLPRIRTQKCFLCHKQASIYHHYRGYAKKHRLDVMPLCYKCDKFIHFCLNALKFQCEERFE